ncbi:M1 family metallopeptidase [Cellulomonas xylanilytica]|uniref:Aminopeptidase N n=1 Tax=Cellulomonas xylanilytica TaxID=233583 RepID=A0A510V1L9_9CELL|nr:M1 family metallopeptidase [Cellulomonas xylanilytica]GEK20802.1 putative peptidase M1, membrane alanine aminopeptidase [Cellulomonas xylanilytica]
MTQPPEDPYLPGRPAGGLDVDRYELELDYRVATNRLDARAVVHARATRTLDRVSLSLQGVRAGHVLVDGRRPERWVHRDGRITIRLGREVLAGTSLAIEVRYGGQPHPARGPWGEVGWEELEDGLIVAGQPDGAPTWFPCHDSPADKAAFTFTVTAEAGYEVLANGRLVSRTPRAGRVRWVYDQPEPMAPYLATLQIGRYQRLVHGTQLLAPPRLLAAAEHDLARQPAMMALFEELFGPYPFAAGYTVVVTDDVLEIPLEAQGLAVFGANHMDGRRGSERLVAHELAHQWFGNSLTVGSWRDIWLHEGFACYAEWLWSERSGGWTADRHARSTRTRLAGLPQDLLVGDPGPAGMFDDRLYKRGALTLHALRLTVGDDVFVELLRTWTARYRHGTVSTELFVACASEVAGRSLALLVEDWVYRAALPELPGSSGTVPRLG